jgi:hypothetical protein
MLRIEPKSSGSNISYRTLTCLYKFSDTADRGVGGKTEESGCTEHLVRTIKEEEVNLSNDHARNPIGKFIEDIYNHKHFHPWWDT